MSPANSPCAACKFRRTKCTQECVFAPYFPPDQLQKFVCVHTVFGASNVGKLLNELSAAQRMDAVSSLAYEAEERLRDPVYGCVGLISILQHRLKQLQLDLDKARKELAVYIGPQAVLPILQTPTAYMPQQQHYHQGYPSSSAAIMHPGRFVPTGAPQYQSLVHQQQQQMFQAEQLAVAAATTEQLEMMSLNGGSDIASAPVTSTGSSQTDLAAAMPYSLALGTHDHDPYHFQQQQQQPQSDRHQLQAQMSQQPEQAKQQRFGSEEGVALDHQLPMLNYKTETHV